MFKKIILILSLITLLGGCTKMDIKKYINREFFNEKKGGTIIAKIDEIPISLQEIREEMRYSLTMDYGEKKAEIMMLDELVKKGYEEKVINQYLIIKKMIDDNLLDSKDFEVFFKINIKEILLKYFLYKSFFSIPENNRWKEILVTTDSEVLQFYNESKKIFDERGVKKEEALFAIKSDIERRKQELFIRELANYQRNIVEELKTKYKFERKK